MRNGGRRLRRHRAVGGAGAETVEVLLRNGTEASVSFVRAELDGVELPPIKPMVQKALKSFDLGVGGVRAKRPASPPVAGVRWWQFYPSPTVPSGGYAVFQFNFAERSRACSLVLTTDDGRTYPIHIPRYSPPKRRIEYLAFTGDGATMGFRYSKGAPPVAVAVNGAPLKGVKVLVPPGAGRPGAVVAQLPRSIREGEGVLVEVEFPGGVKRFAFIRAMLGVCTVAPNGKSDSEPLPEGVRSDYGFDPAMRVYRIPCDVACSDTKAQSYGANARSVVAARVKYNLETPDGLSGVDFCTALYPAVWNIYSQIGDVVISKPYKLHWGRNPQRFIDEEEAFLAEVVKDVAPRPVVWMPERFRWVRELDGGEFGALAWSAILNGARGVRVHHWMNDRKQPFNGNPGLADAVRTFNRDFNRLRPKLERLIPMWRHENRTSRIVVHEGWCGTDGMLLFVRNLRYDVGLEAVSGRRIRPFSAKRVSHCRFSLPLPPWFSLGEAMDALTGEKIQLTSTDVSCEIALDDLEVGRLVWLSSGH